MIMDMDTAGTSQYFTPTHITYSPCPSPISYVEIKGPTGKEEEVYIIGKEKKIMTSSSSRWVKTITSPFRKACHTIFNNQQQHNNSSTGRDRKKSHRQTAGTGVVADAGGEGGGGGARGAIMDVQLQGEVMACGYEDVQVMWSILDKPNTHTQTHPPPCPLRQYPLVLFVDNY